MDRPTKGEVWEALIIVPAALAVAVFSLAAFPLKLALVSCLLGWAMLAIAVIDARQFIIPDVLSLPAIPIGLLASGRLLEPSADGLVRIDHVVGMLAGGLGLWLVRAVYFRVRRREGLGLGDVKLAAPVGTVLSGASWSALAVGAVLAAAITSCVALLRLCVSRAPPHAAVPHGPSMLAAAWLLTLATAAGGG